VQFGETWLVLERAGYSVAVNLGPQKAALPVPADSVVELSWGDVEDRADPAGELRVGPDAVAVVRTGGVPTVDGT
jgi:hypothetical protein